MNTHLNRGFPLHLRITSLSFVIKRSWVGVKPCPIDDFPFPATSQISGPRRQGAHRSIVWGILLRPTLPGVGRERANPSSQRRSGTQSLTTALQSNLTSKPSFLHFLTSFLHRLSDWNSQRLKTFPWFPLKTYTWKSGLGILHLFHLGLFQKTSFLTHCYILNQYSPRSNHRL